MMKQHYHLGFLLSLAMVIMLVFGLSGCSDSSNAEPDTAGKPLVTLVARPTGTEVSPGQQVAIAAEVVTDSEIKSIQWKAEDGGKLSRSEGQSVIYTAPDTPGLYTVGVVVANENGSTTDSVTFGVPTPTVALAEEDTEQPEGAAAALAEEPTAIPTKEPTTEPTEPPISDTPTPPSPPVTSDTVVKAIRVDTPPIIDGRLDDQVWSLAEPLLYAEHPLVNDLTKIVVKLLWDNKYLYAGFDVSDTQVEGSSIDNVWDGDSVGAIIRNGGEIQEHRYSMPPPERAGSTDNIETVNRVADRAGTTNSKSFFKVGTTLNDPGDQDEGYTVEMRIPWEGDAPPAVGSMIAVDLWSIDHDDNPGKRHDDPDTVISKISWDGDQNVNTAGKSILLLADTLPLAVPVITSVTPKPESCPIEDNCTTIVTVNWAEIDPLKLYVLVHPNPDDPNQSYWVQTLPKNKEANQWISSDIFIGQPGDEAGLPFEICAIATDQSLHRGQELVTPPTGPISCVGVTRGGGSSETPSTQPPTSATTITLFVDKNTATASGKVSGLDSAQYSAHKVLVYLKTDQFYIQPVLGGSAPIQADGSWEMTELKIVSGVPTTAYAYLSRRDFQAPDTSRQELEFDGVDIIARAEPVKIQ